MPAARSRSSGIPRRTRPRVRRAGPTAPAASCTGRAVSASRWENDNTLKLETDTGQQTRLFNFGNPQPPAGEPTWQGFSVAAWELPGGGRGRRGGGAGAPGAADAARIVDARRSTTRMRPGYYRRNGVPYGANATMTEWFTTITEPDGNTYLLVTKILEDPQYMSGPYVRTVQFKKENGTAGLESRRRARAASQEET